MLALIAGHGRLPEAVARAVRRRGQPLEVFALRGHAPAPLNAVEFRVGQLGSFIRHLRARGIRQVCLAGGVVRPTFEREAIDKDTLPLLARLATAPTEGDDALLRTVLRFFQEAGITPVAPHDLAPELLAPAGILCGSPVEQDRRDLDRARAVHRALSQVDVGQGVVVASNHVLAVETWAGTDWMLHTLKPEKNAPASLPHPASARPAGGVLFKAPKIGQDRRVDLPAIGPHTVRMVAEAGLRGIAFEAGGVMVLEREDTEAAARAAGLFLWGVG